MLKYCYKGGKENENQKISTKTYSYEKKEYTFRNFSIKPVNVTKYNSD